MIKYLMLALVALLTACSCSSDNKNAYQKGVTTYLQRHLNDPDSYEGVEWGELMKEPKNKFKQIQDDDQMFLQLIGVDTLYIIKHAYRAKNGYGALMLHENYFVMDKKGNVKLEL